MYILQKFTHLIKLCVTPPVSYVYMFVSDVQWRSQKYFPGGANGGGLGAEAPSGVQGRSPGGGLGGRSPPEADHFLLK